MVFSAQVTLVSMDTVFGCRIGGSDDSDRVWWVNGVHSKGICMENVSSVVSWGRGMIS